MNFGFWNVRGMNKEVKQRVVNTFLHTNNVGLFGLLETKVKFNNVHRIVNNIFSDWSVSTNNSKHPGGRVWVIWKPHMFEVHFIKYDAQFIHLHVTNKFNHMKFFYTIIYAFNRIGERESLWLNLRNLAQQIHGPWAIGGDFNCVVQANERLGGMVSNAEAEPFSDCLQDCGLLDIVASGSFYTWNNKQPYDTRVYSMLDRFFVNQEWVDAFPHYMANFLPEGHFDHTPCLVSEGDKGGRQNRPFKYFDMWSSAPGFQECVTKAWSTRVLGTNMYKVVRKLKMLKPGLKLINRSHFSDIENSADIAFLKLTHIQKQLIVIRGRDLSSKNMMLIRSLFPYKQLNWSISNKKLKHIGLKMGTLTLLTSMVS
ncbi:uncharacterized protein LOC141651735 [Silene latifolia]|uniref:uncharacterized protein LOC141651735 n=1 Tax=Silene latifolia TaxID=37657 RepID=UPI003D7846F7